MEIAPRSEALNLVNGEKVRGEPYPVFNPAKYSEVVGLAHGGSAVLVDQAVEAASQAARRWAQTALDDRMTALRSAYDALVAAAGSAGWPTLLTREQGKVLAESRVEVASALRRLQAGLAIAKAALEDQILEDERGRRVSLYEPLGVVAIITPWNWPVLLTLSKVVPALLAGNAVVVKPAPNTPLTITAVLETLSSALPPGVLNVVHGEAEVGSALVRHPKVRKVNFTGSVASGRKVYASASVNVKNLTLELGGNDPAIVLDDCRFTREMVDAMLAGIFTTTGQVCMAIKRIYVHESRHDELRDALVEGAKRYIVGDGLDPGVTLGPLNNRAQYERLSALAAMAKAAGAVLTAAGSRSPQVQWSLGYYMQPAVATEVNDSMELVTEEQFGPVIPLLRFHSDEEALERANDSEYGLSASVWGSNIERAFAVSRQLSAGFVAVNAHGLAALDHTLAFGGVRQSGLGRQGAIEGMRNFTNQRYLHNRTAG